MTPSGMRGILNDAVSLYFADATLASAFITRWCVAGKLKWTGGVFQVREDERCRECERWAAQDSLRTAARRDALIANGSGISG